jgi:hypothetical protein
LEEACPERGQAHHTDEQSEGASQGPSEGGRTGVSKFGGFRSCDEGKQVKHCNGCSTSKDKSEFWKSQSLCIVCTKDRQKSRWNSRSPKKRLEQHLKYKYGVTHQEFISAWTDQSGKCSICFDELPDLMQYANRRRGYAIDHNHETGKFRGILCLRCNSLLGMAKESSRILASAIGYLEKNGSYEHILVDNAAVARTQQAQRTRGN